MSIIQFPQDQKSRIEISVKAAKRKRKKTFPQQVYAIHIPSLTGIKDNIEHLNDTMKYVTDCLYSISMELKETKEQITEIKSTSKRAFNVFKNFVIILIFWLFIY